MPVSDYRHPQEVQRLDALQNVKALNLILNVFNKAYASITSFATVSERNYPVTELTQPRLYRLYRQAKEKLGITEDVLIYLNFDYGISAETIGTDGDCAILVTNCALETLTDGELMALIARELGHIAHNHVKYINIIRFFDDLTRKLTGIAETAILTTKNVLLEWLRCAEYTADRAAAIASGSVEPPCMAILKAMGAVDGYPQLRFDLKQVISQPLPDFPGEGLGKMGQIAFQNIMSMVQVPFGMVRMKELWDWSQSEECRQCFSHVSYSNSWTFGLEKQTDPDALYKKAAAAASKSPEQTLALLHRAARCGSPGAMCSLGKMYLEGKWVNQDPVQAMGYLQYAVAAKFPEAYTLLGLCYLNGIPGTLAPNTDMGHRLLRCAREKGDTSAQKHLLQYHQPSYAGVKAVEETVKAFAGKKTDPDCYVLHGNPQEAKKWFAFLDIPGDEKLFVLAVNSAYPGQYAALCSSGLYYLTGKTIPQYCAWETLRKQKLIRQENFGRIDLMAEEKLLYSCDEETVDKSVMVLLEGICSPQ